jgi:hypothetical protein
MATTKTPRTAAARSKAGAAQGSAPAQKKAKPKAAPAAAKKNTKASAQPTKADQPKAKARAASPKDARPRKPKIVRDSFSIPKDEYAVLEELKARAARLGRPAKKSEVVRAGVRALAALGDAAFLASVGALPAAGAAKA